jgi:hypothetical protein
MSQSLRLAKHEQSFSISKSVLTQRYPQDVFVNFMGANFYFFSHPYNVDFLNMLT